MSRGERRSAARLAAVQALYQMDVASKGVEEVFAEFEAHWIGREVEGAQYKAAETAFFRDIVQGVLIHQVVIDRQIDQTLSDGWPLARVESVIRAVLRAGDFELRKRADIPARVIVSEYCDVAAAFFGRDEVGMINAVLDSLARALRPDEFSRA